MEIPKFVQLLATVEEDGNVRPATPEEMAKHQCLWSVYKGKPGDFAWLADFLYWIDAAAFARKQAQFYGAKLIEGGA